MQIVTLSSKYQVCIPKQIREEMHLHETLALNIIGVTEQSTIVILDIKYALFAADLAKQYNLAMADAIVYANESFK